MANTIIVAGYGPGISQAVARRFGREGYAVALVGRSRERLEAGVASLRAAGIGAAAFPTDLGDEAAATALPGKVRRELGRVSVLHWNAYAPLARDLLSAPGEELRRVLDVGVHSLLAATRAALAELSEARGSLLVTGGGLAFYERSADQLGVAWGAMGLAVSKAAQHKLVGLLHASLAERGVFVGEVTVTALVKGTPFDLGQATLEPDSVAEAFWTLHQRRDQPYTTIG